MKRRSASPALAGPQSLSQTGAVGEASKLDRAAIATTSPDGRAADHRPDGKGGYFTTLPQGVVDRLNDLREPGQSYSEVILRLAKAE